MKRDLGSPNSSLAIPTCCHTPIRGWKESLPWKINLTECVQALATGRRPVTHSQPNSDMKICQRGQKCKSGKRISFHWMQSGLFPFQWSPPSPQSSHRELALGDSVASACRSPILPLVCSCWVWKYSHFGKIHVESEEKNVNLII